MQTATTILGLSEAEAYKALSATFASIAALGWSIDFYVGSLWAGGKEAWRTKRLTTCLGAGALLGFLALCALMLFVLEPDWWEYLLLVALSSAVVIFCSPVLKLAAADSAGSDGEVSDGRRVPLGLLLFVAGVFQILAAIST